MTEDSPSSRTHGSLCSLSLCPPRHSSRGLSGRGRSLQREGRSLPQPRTGRALQCSESLPAGRGAVPGSARLLRVYILPAALPPPLPLAFSGMRCAPGTAEKGPGWEGRVFGTSHPHTPPDFCAGGGSRLRAFSSPLPLRPEPRPFLCLCLSVFLPLFSAPCKEPPHPLLESPPDCSF